MKTTIVYDMVAFFTDRTGKRKALYCRGVGPDETSVVEAVRAEIARDSAKPGTAVAVGVERRWEVGGV